MRYEIGNDVCRAVVDDSGVRIIEKTRNRFIPFEKIVAVSVKKPGTIIAGNISFQTAQVTSGANTLSGRGVVPFKGKEQYELACKIQEEIEKRI